MIQRPKATLWQKKRVKVSVARLKLVEHEPLAEARKAVWQKMSREIKGYLSAKSKSGAGNNPVAKKITPAYSKHSRNGLARISVIIRSTMVHLFSRRIYAS